MTPAKCQRCPLPAEIIVNLPVCDGTPASIDIYACAKCSRKIAAEDRLKRPNAEPETMTWRARAVLASRRLL